MTDILTKLCLVGAAVLFAAWMALRCRGCVVRATDALAKVSRARLAAFLFFVAVSRTETVIRHPSPSDNAQAPMLLSVRHRRALPWQQCGPESGCPKGSTLPFFFNHLAIVNRSPHHAPPPAVRIIFARYSTGLERTRVPGRHKRHRPASSQNAIGNNSTIPSVCNKKPKNTTKQSVRIASAHAFSPRGLSVRSLAECYTRRRNS